MIESENKIEKTNESFIKKKKYSIFTILKSNSSSNIYKCFYEDCKRSFKEKGNLKTHIRTHVIKYLFRLVKDLIYVITIVVEKLSFLREILNHIYVIIQEKNLIYVIIKHVEKSIVD